MTLSPRSAAAIAAARPAGPAPTMARSYAALMRYRKKVQPQRSQRSQRKPETEFIFDAIRCSTCTEPTAPCPLCALWPICFLRINTGLARALLAPDAHTFGNHDQAR